MSQCEAMLTLIRLRLDSYHRYFELLFGDSTCAFYSSQYLSRRSSPVV